MAKIYMSGMTSMYAQPGCIRRCVLCNTDIPYCYQAWSISDDGWLCRKCVDEDRHDGKEEINRMGTIYDKERIKNEPRRDEVDTPQPDCAMCELSEEKRRVVCDACQIAANRCGTNWPG